MIDFTRDLAWLDGYLFIHCEDGTHVKNVNCLLVASIQFMNGHRKQQVEPQEIHPERRSERCPSANPRWVV
jgi:hypothetical protein